MAKLARLSTVDNPFDPFTEFDQWFDYDESQGYHSSSLLARVLVTSEEIPEILQERDNEEAIDEIVKENVSGIHIKVVKDV